MVICLTDLENSTESSSNPPSTASGWTVLGEGPTVPREGFASHPGTNVDAWLDEVPFQENSIQPDRGGGVG